MIPPLVLAVIMLGGMFVIIGVRFYDAHRQSFPKDVSWTPAKQLVFEADQEISHQRAKIAMGVGLCMLWGSAIFLAVPYFLGWPREEHARMVIEPQTSVRIAGCAEK